MIFSNDQLKTLTCSSEITCLCDDIGKGNTVTNVYHVIYISDLTVRAI